MVSKIDVMLFIIAVAIIVGGILVIKDLATASAQTKGVATIEQKELQDDQEDDNESLKDLVRDANADKSSTSK